MNYKEHFKSYLMEMLFLSEEERRIRKATPQQAAALRAAKGTPERQETFGGRNRKTPTSGTGFDILTPRQQKRVRLMSELEGRVPEQTVHDNPKQPGLGLRNRLLYGTKPGDSGVSMDAISPRVSTREFPKTEAEIEYAKMKEEKTPREKQIIALAARHVMDRFGIELEPKHYDGLEINHPDFLKFVTERLNSRSRSAEEYLTIKQQRRK